MFDIGFWELCLVGIVALIVLGPEKLPRAARTAGLWLAKTRRTLATVQEEVRRELELEDLEQLGASYPSKTGRAANTPQDLAAPSGSASAPRVPAAPDGQENADNAP
ncbi:MAG: Sec-independent protein translocase protein TatB [Gammaproteobacteria bacterium]